MIRITLPIPPSVNTLYINAGKGRRISPIYSRWQSEAILALKPQSYGTVKGRYRFNVWVSETMRGDVDNRLKAALDFCVAHAITPDDRHCVAAHAEKRADVPSGSCIIEITAAE